jgi:TRAP-type C4-dicarboxylate transport system permease large subunit
MSVVNTTGIGFRFATVIVNLGDGSLFLALGLAMISSLILEIGLPTLPAYFLVAIFLAPVVAELGVNVLLAHLFVLLFAILSNVTPPVAIAAYTAAPIAGRIRSRRDSKPCVSRSSASSFPVSGFTTHRWSSLSIFNGMSSSGSCSGCRSPSG